MKSKLTLSVLLLLTASALVVLRGSAVGDYAVDWWSSDGGGAATSTGGSYSLGGTIGQPDAGPAMTGGAFSIIGGFWGAALPPALSISGSAGIPGATLTYTGGSTTANGSGDYSITVPYNWSGAVTPSKSGYTFSPDHKDYANVTTDQPNEDYVATATTAWVGSASITSDRNVVAVGRPEIGSQVMAYDGFAAGATTMYVPMLFRDAFGEDYNAAMVVQNVDAANPASITITYRDTNGSLTCSHADSIPAQASHSYWMADECVPAGWVGGAVVTANHNIAAVGRVHTGLTEITSYNGLVSGGTLMYEPMMFRKAFDGTYNAAMYIQNTDAALAADITISYYDVNGVLTCTHPDSIPALSSHAYWSPLECMPDGWFGAAVISSNRDIVAVARPNIGTQETAYRAFIGGTTTAYVPMMYKNGPGQTPNTAMYIQNTDPVNAANVTIDYYDRNGSLTCTHADTISSLSSHAYWSVLECTPNGWTGAAVITANHNIVALGRPHFGAEIFAYNGFTAGALQQYLPMLFSNAYGGSYNSAFYVQNLDTSQTANLTIKYYDTNGNLTCTKTDSINAMAAKETWVPDVVPACP